MRDRTRAVDATPMLLIRKKAHVHDFIKSRGQPFFFSVYTHASIENTGKQPVDILYSLLASALGLRNVLDAVGRLALPVLSRDQVAIILLGELVENGADETPGVLAVGGHVAHDHGDVNVGRRVPAVIVGRHANHLVCDLGFAREFGFGQRRHVDD